MDSIKIAKTLYKFDKLRKKFSEIPYINFGGGAIVAYMMYMWLTKRGINCGIVYMYRDWNHERYEKNNMYISRKRKRVYGCSHAGVIISGNEGIYDCEKVIDYDEYDYQHTVPVELVLASLKRDEWNEFFDRKKYVPHMEMLSGIKIPLQ